LSTFLGTWSNSLTAKGRDFPIGSTSATPTLESAIEFSLSSLLFPTTILFGEVFYRLVLWAFSVVGEGSIQMDEIFKADVIVVRLYGILIELDLQM
jgi:hypothetical protein